ncbi:MAG: hypothetical protein P8Y58_00625 [Novosphingobium sp.]
MLTIDPRLLSMMLLGYGDSQRQLLETPILGDTWASFAAHPAGRHALLLTSNHGTNAADLADELAKHFEGIEDLAAAQGFVAGTFDLGHLIEAQTPPASRPACRAGKTSSSRSNGCWPSKTALRHPLRLWTNNR